jgi:U3 small nucleolar RNA-associated protein 22
MVHVGIILNTEHAYTLVDYGPPVTAEDTEAKDPHNEERVQFRTLWGPKVELRRFRDGRILESVVWEVATVDERAHIPFLICQYLLRRHCGIGVESMNAVGWTGRAWDDMLKINGTITQLYRTTKAETGFKAAMSAFDGLVKTLKSLDDELPLAILNISPVSPLLRYTNVFSPVAIPPTSDLLTSPTSVALPLCARYVPRIDIIIEFEKNGRWPDDLKAIQKVKLAFLEAIAVSLGKKIDHVQVQIVLEDGQADGINDTARLEILTPEGWAFSASIWHDREVKLLEDLIDNKPHVPKAIKRALRKNTSSEDIRMRYDAIRAKDIYLRRYIHSPRHHRAVAALSQQYSAYAGTVRLVKRWLASHWLLGGHIKEEAVELLCAAIFLTSPKREGEKPKASVPQTKERGFALVVLFLSHWEWENGLFVPIYGDETEEAVGKGVALGTNSAGRRAVWALRTEHDLEGNIWTVDGPDAVVARRVTAVAKATLSPLRACEGSDTEIKVSNQK